MTLRDAWIRHGVEWTCAPGSDAFWSGARLILSHRVLHLPTLDDSLSLTDVGYTPYKLTRLHDQYFVSDAVDTAMQLHARNVARHKYASAAFHCYGHLLKGDFVKKSRRASVMGPCIQSVILTLHPHQKRTVATVVYRTTEYWKKLPADFVWLRERILPLVPGQASYPITWRFQFVSVTLHPMYCVTALPYLADPIATMERWRTANPAFWQWAGKWLARYIIGGAAGRSIEKFAQAMRTADAANALITGSLRHDIILYLCDHRTHFMPRNTRFDLTDLNQAFEDARNHALSEFQDGD